MANNKPQIAVKSTNNQTISPVLKKFLQMQQDVLEGKEEEDSATTEVHSSGKLPTKPTDTLDRNKKTTGVTPTLAQKTVQGTVSGEHKLHDGSGMNRFHKPERALPDSEKPPELPKPRKTITTNDDIKTRLLSESDKINQNSTNIQKPHSTNAITTRPKMAVPAAQSNGKQAHNMKVKDTVRSKVDDLGEEPTLPAKTTSPHIRSTNSQLPGQKTNSPGLEPKGANTSVVLQQHSGSKKFKKVNLDVNSTKQTAPTKVALACQIDLTQIKHQYHKVLQRNSKTETSEGAGHDSDDGDYVDTSCVVDHVLRRPSGDRQPRQVSLIADITADEEEGSEYDDGYTPPRAIVPGNLVYEEPTSDTVGISNHKTVEEADDIYDFVDSKW